MTTDGPTPGGGSADLPPPPGGGSGDLPPPPGGGVMPRARVAALDETTDVSTVLQRCGPSDPLDLLADRLQPVVARAVDALQVAAVLESRGLTDRTARVQFGVADVFDLAQRLYERLRTQPPPPPPRTGRPASARLRDAGHGLIYLLPAMLYPVAFATFAERALLVGVVAVGAAGWVLCGITVWLAYRLAGEGRAGAAAETLRWSGLAAVVVAAIVGAVVADRTGAGYGLVVVAVAQMAFHVAAATLVFYRREGLLVLAMLPGAVTGVGYLAARPALGSIAPEPGLAAWPAIAAVAGALSSVALAFALALRQTLAVACDGNSPGEAFPWLLRGRGRALVPVTVQMGLSAAFLLFPQSRLVRHGLDVALALLPLMLGMGAVECWASDFRYRARAVLARAYRPSQFVARICLRLAAGLAFCIGTVAMLAVGLLLVLGRFRPVSEAAVLLAGTGAVLAGAYFLGFLLADLGRLRWLCGSLAVGIAVYASAVAIGGGGALADVIAFLAASGAMLALCVVGLAGRIGHAYRFR